MARAHLRHVVQDRAGNAIQNAVVSVFLTGTSTLVTDLYSTATAGSPISTASIVTNNQGEAEGWLDTAKTVDLQVSDNGHAAYYSGAVGELLTFSPFIETVEVPPPPENVATLDGNNTFAGTVTFLVDPVFAGSAGDTVHLSGTETVTGDKTFSGTNAFTGSLIASGSVTTISSATTSLSGTATNITTARFAGKPTYDITHPTYGASTSASGATNAAAINAAINAANAAGGGTVEVPSGTFNVALTDAPNALCLHMKSNVRLRGQAGATLRLADNAAGNASGTRIIGTPSTSGYSNVVIENLLIDGNTANNPSGVVDSDHGIFLSGVSNIWITRNEIKNCGSDGLYLHGGDPYYCIGYVGANAVHGNVRVGINAHGSINTTYEGNWVYDTGGGAGSNWAFKMEFDTNNKSRFGNRFISNIGWNLGGGISISGATTTTTLSANASAAATSISVAATPGIAGATLLIDPNGSREWVVIDSVSGSGPYTVNLRSPLLLAHSSGDTVVTGRAAGIDIAHNRFDCENATGAVISMSTCDDSKITDNTLSGGKGQSINLSKDCVRIDIERNTIKALTAPASGTTGAIAIGAGAAGTGSTQISDITICKNKVYGGPQHGIYLSNTTSTQAAAVIRSSLEGNSLLSCASAGIGLSGTMDVGVVGNHIRDCGGSASNEGVRFYAASQAFSDGVSSNGSATFTSATANFTALDNGLTITSPSNTPIPAGTTITVVNSTTITLSNVAVATNAAASFTIVNRWRNWRTKVEQNFFEGSSNQTVGLHVAASGAGIDTKFKNNELSAITTPITNPTNLTGSPSALDNALDNGSGTMASLGTTAIQSSVSITEAGNLSVGTSTGTKIGTATTQKLGFWNATPVVQPSAYTQTYATSTKTHANLTSATLTDNSAGTANTTVEALPDPADTPASADALRDDLVANLIPALRNNIADLTAQVNALRVDLVNAKGVLNAVIDDDQAIGIKS